MLLDSRNLAILAPWKPTPSRGSPTATSKPTSPPSHPPTEVLEKLRGTHFQRDATCALITTSWSLYSPPDWKTHQIGGLRADNEDLQQELKAANDNYRGVARRLDSSSAESSARTFGETERNRQSSGTSTGW